jgi:hypothetical protein
MRLISHQFIVWGHRWPCFSPDGECLSFASPKERHQRKGDPSSSPFGFPSRSGAWLLPLQRLYNHGLPLAGERTGASPTRPNRLHKTQSVAELKQGYAFFPSVHFDSATQQGEPRGRSTDSQILHLSKKESVVHPLGPLLCRREAQPHGEKRCRVSELRSTRRFVSCVRANCGSAPCGEHRMEAKGRHTRGRLVFGYFLLAKQKKVTRHQAKTMAGYYPITNT